MVQNNINVSENLDPDPKHSTIDLLLKVHLMNFLVWRPPLANLSSWYPLSFSPSPLDFLVNLLVCDTTLGRKWRLWHKHLDKERLHCTLETKKGWKNFARTPLNKDFDSAMYCVPSASTYWHHLKQEGHEGVSLYHTAEASHSTQA